MNLSCLVYQILETKEERLKEVKQVIPPPISPRHLEYEQRLLESAERMQELMREQASRRGSQVKELKQQSKAEEQAKRERVAEEDRLAGLAELTREESAAIHAAMEQEAIHEELERKRTAEVHKDLESKVGVSQLSLKKTENGISTLKRRLPKHAHPMLAQIDDFLADDDFLDDE